MQVNISDILSTILSFPKYLKNIKLVFMNLISSDHKVVACQDVLKVVIYGTS